MKSARLCVTGALSLVLAASAAAQNGATIFGTGFEPDGVPPYTLGDLAGQNGWMMAPGRALATVQGAVVNSGSQAAEIVDAASFGRVQLNISTTEIGPVFVASHSMYVPAAWATIPSEVLDRFEAQQRLEFTGGGGTVGIEFGYITTNVAYNGLSPGDSAYYVEMTKGDQVESWMYAPAGPGAIDAWHRYELDVNIGTGMMELRVDGALVGRLAGPSDLLSLSVLQLQNQRWGTNPQNSASLFFDDILVETTSTPACYPNCDQSATPPILNVLDFNCFINRFTAGSAYANCDGSTEPPVLNVLDFNCFLNRFAEGCR